MITVLVISACLSGQPGVCRDFKTALDETVTPSQCFMTAPIQLAQWYRENPGWQFTRVTCKSVQTLAEMNAT